MLFLNLTACVFFSRSHWREKQEMSRTILLCHLSECDNLETSKATRRDNGCETKESCWHTRNLKSVSEGHYISYQTREKGRLLA